MQEPHGEGGPQGRPIRQRLRMPRAARVVPLITRRCPIDRLFVLLSSRQLWCQHVVRKRTMMLPITARRAPLLFVHYRTRLPTGAGKPKIIAR